MKAPRVAIVGAGPGGLVSAKTFRDAGFDLTIFESKGQIGGIWALETPEQRTFLSMHTPSNLSRFSVSFTDLDWNACDANVADSHGSCLSLFPEAWQINRYLQEYRRRFIPEEILRVQSTVVHARLADNAPESSTKWQLTIQDAKGNVSEEKFDFLLVAAGIFSGARPLKYAMPTMAKDLDSLPINVIHSSDYRSLDDLFSSSGAEISRKNILVIGGANSGGEAAAAVAMHISNAQWSPDQRQRALFEDSKVIHVASRPFYGVPPYLEYELGSRSYVPLDWKMYDLSKKPPGPLTPSIGVANSQKIEAVHGFLQDVIGSDQSDLGCAALVSPSGPGRGAPYAALTEQYNEFVRSGLINVIGGRVVTLEETGTGSVAALVQQKLGSKSISNLNVDAVIYATGYTPCPAIEFLSEDIKQQLEFDPTNMRVPLVLDQWQTANPSVPEIAFVGWYEGPFWPVIEMQARLIARRWLTGERAAPTSVEDSKSMAELRNLMHERSALVPQYWFTDYAAQMEVMATVLNLTRNDGTWGEREGCPSPARYLSGHSDREAATSVMSELAETWHACLTDGKFVARAVFRALHGDWDIHRRIESADQNFRGTLTGTASFYPRLPTSDSSGRTFDREYLYIESGEFVSASGFSMRATRRYVYRYSERDDSLSVWFVKPQNELEVDYLFHDLKFISPEDARQAGASIARADHLCVKDFYRTEYRLPMKGVTLYTFDVTHEVKGPSKDYVAQTRYTRPERKTLV